MRSHVRLLGILQLTWGAIGLLLGAALLLLAVGALAIGLMETGDRVAAGVTAFTFGLFAVALLLGGAANAWAGRAVRRHEPAGRSAVIWLSVPNLFVLPFGTALGVYALWVLLHNEARGLFLGLRS
jgi:hypothetical protein